MNESIESRSQVSMPDYNIGHPTTKPIAEDVKFLPCDVAQDAVSSTRPYTLEPTDIEFFKQYGYLIKRGLLGDQTSALRKAQEHFWEHVPGHRLRRDDPATWVDNPASHWQPEDHARVGTLLGTNWKMRSRGDDGIGTETFLVDQLANHPRMMNLASAFLGARIKPVRRVRGIYGVLPIADTSQDRMYPHGD